MKTNWINDRKKKSWRRMLLLAGWVLSCLPALTGCSQDAESILPGTPGKAPAGDYIGEPVAIGVSVSGVDEYFGGKVARSGEVLERTVQPLDSTCDTGYQIETTIEALPSVNPVQARGALENVQFRIAAYKNNSITAGNYAGTAVFSTNGSGIATIVAGSASPASGNGMWILAPGTYAFVCYSYGTNATPPAMTGNISANVTHDQDFMTCHKAGVPVTADSNGQYMLQGISFSRQCAQLQLSFTAALNGNNTVTECVASVANLNGNTVVWSANQTSLTNTGTGGSKNIAWTNPNGSTVASNVYKVLPMNSRSLAISFTNLKIGGASYNNTVSVNAGGRVFSAKGNYKISVKLLPGKIIIWAPGNLVKNGNVYSFAGKTANGSYFGWNTLSDATGAYNSGAYDINQDPCTKVSPAGTWVTPTSGQLQELLNSGSDWTSSGRQFKGVYSDVFLPAAGYRYSDGGMYVVGSEGYYWSSTPYGRGADYLYIDSGTAYISSYGLNDGRSVRCVKGS